MTDNNRDILLDEALDICEQQGRHVTQQQLERLDRDGELLEACRDLMALHRGVAEEVAPVDVDRQWERFSQRYRPAATRHIGWYVALAAAAAVLALLVVTRPWHSAPKDTLVGEAPLIVYRGDSVKQPVTVIRQNGVTVSATPQQSVDDILSDIDEHAVEEVLTVSVPKGETYSLDLPDGSRVLLYADSRVVFPTRFQGTERQVRLTGEAYFIVARDPQHPFIVKTPFADTQVLGTEFYVRAYGEDDDLVALVSGSVCVSNDRHSVVMKPNEQAVMHADQFVVSTIDTMPFTAWRDGYLYFDDVELEDVMKAIGKNYNLSVEFRNSRLLSDRVHFVAARNEGIGEVIKTVNRMGRIHVWQEGSTLVVE